jgi:predicted deacetylase
MPPTTPPLEFNHAPGFEIPTKHKEAIRQLHDFGHKSVKEFIARYKLSKTTIRQILGYPAPERKRLTRTGRLKELSDIKVDKIIEYLSTL